MNIVWELFITFLKDRIIEHWRLIRWEGMSGILQNDCM